MRGLALLLRLAASPVPLYGAPGPLLLAPPGPLVRIADFPHCTFGHPDPACRLGNFLSLCVSSFLLLLFFIKKSPSPILKSLPLLGSHLLPRDTTVFRFTLRPLQHRFATSSFATHITSSSAFTVRLYRFFLKYHTSRLRPVLNFLSTTYTFHKPFNMKSALFLIASLVSLAVAAPMGPDGPCAQVRDAIPCPSCP